MNIVIIGGVAAGTKAAAKLKRENAALHITILSKNKDISYAGCGLPYYVGGAIPDAGKLIVNTPESFSALTGAEVHVNCEAVAIDRKAKIVRALSLETGEESVHPYDKLIIASGADTVRPRLPGSDLQGVYYLRTPEDAIRLRHAVDGGLKRAVVVGGGFIGLEVAENLLEKGIEVTVMDMAPQVLPGFDPEMAAYVENHLKKIGITVLNNEKVAEILGDGRVTGVRAANRTIPAEAVVLSVGIRPNTAFVQEAGLELWPDNTIKVDSRFRTLDPDVYAIGDCIRVTNRITGKSQWSPMGSSANLEGRMLAIHLAKGGDKDFQGVLGTTICKLPKLNAAKTGLGEMQAKEAGFAPVTAIAVVDDKAHYYPGAANFIIKMIADRDSGRLLGVQVLGPGAVDKIIDIAATAITFKAGLADLENMDLAYAPPFSTAIHPFSHAVNILRNKIDGGFETFTPLEFAAGMDKGYIRIDASNMPAIAQLPHLNVKHIIGPLKDYAPEAKLLLICMKGKGAYLTQARLKSLGYANTRVLEGGLAFNAYQLPY